jgi:diaminopimelate epimerase
MNLRFTKMQGAGNDFVMLDGIGQRLDLTPERLRRLADRHYGVGADQILVVEAAPDASVDFRYRIFNADGGEVEQCGNGARCFVKFVHQLGLTKQRTIRVLTAGGRITPRLEDDGRVSVDMGAPDFDPAASGLRAAGLNVATAARARLWSLPLEAGVVAICVVSMGNPHAVQIVADTEQAPVEWQGPQLEHHPRFASGVNAGFAQVLDRSNLRLRVWERGTGETLACGTGACAAAVAGIRMGRLDSPVWVHMRGGRLQVAWEDRAERSDAPAGEAAATAPVYMTGPAEKVFDGQIELP